MTCPIRRKNAGQTRSVIIGFFNLCRRAGQQGNLETDDEADHDLTEQENDYGESSADCDVLPGEECSVDTFGRCLTSSVCDGNERLHPDVLANKLAEWYDIGAAQCRWEIP